MWNVKKRKEEKIPKWMTCNLSLLDIWSSIFSSISIFYGLMTIQCYEIFIRYFLTDNLLLIFWFKTELIDIRRSIEIWPIIIASSCYISLVSRTCERSPIFYFPLSKRNVRVKRLVIVVLEMHWLLLGCFILVLGRNI